MAQNTRENTHSQDDLIRSVSRIDGKGYGHYRGVVGSYDFGDLILRIPRVQRDPFAPPTLVDIHMSNDVAGFGREDVTNKGRQIALCDYLSRALSKAIASRTDSVARGSGSSGKIEVAQPGQEIVERTSVQIRGDWIEARIYVGLPARGRRIAGGDALTLLTDVVPSISRAGLMASRLNETDLRAHINVSEDQDTLRDLLDEMGLVSFIADGAILPRISGNMDTPMSAEEAVPFESPHEVRVEVELPHRGKVSGMGIRKGVTLITGGGYHGKSTLLKAIERGVYNHRPGDGRELVVTSSNAVKVRSMEGRSIKRVDLRPFIGRLPSGVDSACFTTADASGSTSQAATVVEYIESGARAILMDEDTSASNFLFRDASMAKLVSEGNEPISPYVGFVRSLADQDVSTVMAVGGTGAFFAKADCVLRMTEYVTEVVTEEAKSIAEAGASGVEDRAASIVKAPRVPRSWNTRDGRARARVRCQQNVIHLGRERIDTSDLEQLCVAGQDEAVALILGVCADRIDGRQSVEELVQGVLLEVRSRGLNDVCGDNGRLTLPRELEIVAALNRARLVQF